MKTKTKGFTLVEFLIVIGIIALLISILVPAIHRIQHPSQPTPNPSQQSQNVWIFEEPNYGYGDNFATDLGNFLANHPNLKITSQTGANFDYKGRAQQYIVTTEEKNTPSNLER